MRQLILNRQQRKEHARQTGTPFEPRYNEGLLQVDDNEWITTGGAPRKYEDVYGRKMGERKPKKAAAESK